MQWTLFATLAEAAGRREVTVSPATENPTLEDAFEALTDECPELQSVVFDSDGSLQSHIRLLCDGQDPFQEGDGWEEPVDDVDELALFPPVSGG